MKNLIFISIFISSFCYGSNQQDSIKIIQQLTKLEQVNNETKMLLKKADKIDKENRSLIFKIKKYIEKITQNNESQKALANGIINRIGLIPSNINEPILEIDTPDGFDTIRGNFFYRLFHQNPIILKPYKIINDEKFYLD